MSRPPDRASPARPRVRPGPVGARMRPGNACPSPRALVFLALLAAGFLLAAAPAPSFEESLAAADRLLEGKRWDRAVRALDLLVAQLDRDAALTPKALEAARLELASRADRAGTALIAPIDLQIGAASWTKAVNSLNTYIKRFQNFPAQVDAAQARIATIQATAPPGSYRESAKSELDRVLAQTLIRQRRYQEALTALTLFSKTYPDRFDDAQKLFSLVMTEREKYNRKVLELKKALATEPDNNELHNRLYNETVRLNPYPDKATATQLTGLNVGIGLKVVAQAFERIMEAARKELDAGNWRGAVQSYLPGFDDLYRDAFNQWSQMSDAAGNRVPTPLRLAVDARVTAVQTAAEEYAATRGALEAAATTLAEAFDGREVTAVVAALEMARPLLTAQARRRELFSQAGAELGALWPDVDKTDTEAQESSYLFYANRLLVGRPAADRGGDASPEGVAGAMERQWESLFAPIATALDLRLDRDWAGAELAWNEGRLAAAASAFEALSALAVPGLEVLATWARSSGDALRGVPAAAGAGAPVQAVAWERVSHLGRLAAAHARLASVARTEAAALAEARGWLAGLDAAPPLAEPAVAGARDRLTAWRTVIAGASAAFEAEKPVSLALATELSTWAAAGLGDPRSATAQGAYNGRLSRILGLALADEAFMAASTAGMEWRSVNAEYEARTATVAEGRRNLEGIDDPQLGRVFYPTRSATILVAEEAGLARVRARISDLVGRLGREPAWVASAPAVLSWNEQARNLDRGAAALQVTRLELIARARERAGQAQVARRDADTRQQEVRQTLQRTDLKLEDYDGLVTRLNAVRDRYAASLGYEYDAALSSTSSVAYNDLMARILDGQNAWVVREHRRLINAAIALYSGQDFAGAQENLVAAQNTWFKTHPKEESPEARYWLTLAKSALSANKDKTIAQNAPLYAEMSQLLSQASRLYEDGRGLLARAGSKVEATVRFNAAVEKVNQILVVFPMNQDAGILLLRIEQERDPANFSKLFRKRYDEAVALTRTAPATALGTLQVLESINPKWAGIAAARLEAEYAAGVKTRPQNPADLRRAATLVTQARPIVTNRLAARYTEADTLLNEASRLDPKNADAKDLLDRLRTIRGVISPEFTIEDRRVFDAASQAYLESRYAEAYTTVKLLWRGTPRYRVNQELLDLRDSCEERLNVPQAERLQ